uniref:Large ribosomal subunit protein bL9c n=1 Tax=Dasya naccarioides TaxID=2007180 RepID=A0A1Z1MGR4_9FLOR|nr:ribosomal protein L9 [Dasya naccarioides]ARW65260.1 ribosomal protein L9 [Dasya naccarioides]
MKSKVEIILNIDYPPIGKKNKITKVTRGYAFNYLFPNEIAEIATENKIKHLQMFELIKNQEIEKNKIKAYTTEKNLQSIYKISLTKKTGDINNIFGSVSEKDIIQKIQDYTGIRINKKQIDLPDIKKTGIFNINIKLFYNTTYSMKLYIIPGNI